MAKKIDINPVVLERSADYAIRGQRRRPGTAATIDQIWAQDVAAQKILRGIRARLQKRESRDLLIERAKIKFWGHK